MAFLDDLSKKLTEVGQATVSKTKEIAEMTKYTTSIREEKKKLESFYTELGTYFYNNNKDSVDETYKEHFEQITKSLEKIEELQEQLNSIKEIQNIEENEASASTSVEVENNDAVEETVEDNQAKEGYCKKCGAKLISDGSFCTKCGAKI